jgi:protein-arginine kinase activator protein McsA
MSAAIACSHCGTEFKPLRRSARFCSSTCRVAAHRKSDCNANSAADNLSEGRGKARANKRAYGRDALKKIAGSELPPKGPDCNDG